MVVLSLGVWSAVTLLMGTAGTFDTLYWLRAAMGVSEALYIPAGLALIVDFHRGSTRSLAVGVHMSGLYLGQALGGIGGWIAQDLSWRTAFTGCGGLGIAYAVLLIFLLREHRPELPSTRDRAAANAAGNGSADWVGFALLIACFSLPSLAGWAVKNWMPTLLQDRFAYDQKTSGLMATITISVAGFCGVFIGGKLSDRFSARDVRGRTRVSALGLALIVPSILGIALAPGPALAMAAAVVYGVAFGIFDTNNMPILCQVLPPRLRATGYGILNLAGIAAGAWLTPVLGKLKDDGVSLAWGFVISAMPSLVAALLMVNLRPRAHDIFMVLSLRRTLRFTRTARFICRWLKNRPLTCSRTECAVCL
jgi:MFS family permease